MNNRFDIYLHVHKGLRALMADVLTTSVHFVVLGLSCPYTTFLPVSPGPLDNTPFQGGVAAPLTKWSHSFIKAARYRACASRRSNVRSLGHPALKRRTFA
jgi:hypothetical protein